MINYFEEDGPQVDERSHWVEGMNLSLSLSLRGDDHLHQEDWPQVDERSQGVEGLSPSLKHTHKPLSLSEEMIIYTKRMRVNDD